MVLLSGFRVLGVQVWGFWVGAPSLGLGNLFRRLFGAGGLGYRHLPKDGYAICTST